MKLDWGDYGRKPPNYFKPYQGDDMRRFNYEDNEEHREDVDKFFSENDFTEEELRSLNEFEENEFLQQEMQMKFIEQEFNLKLLRTALRMCEKSFWWTFYTPKARMNILLDTYEAIKMVSEE